MLAGGLATLPLREALPAHRIVDAVYASADAGGATTARDVERLLDYGGVLTWCLVAEILSKAEAADLARRAEAV